MHKYIDIHCHINFAVFDQDRDFVIKRTLEKGMSMINIGTQYDTSKKAVEIAKNYDNGVYATIGLHPIHTEASFHDKSELGEEGKEFTSRGEIFDKEKYKELALSNKVVAIGECGLDYYHLSEESMQRQQNAFIAQIELANDLDLPLMLHIRNNEDNINHNAYIDVLNIIKKYPKTKGVVHFFAGTLENALAFIDLGFYISFSGVITYRPKKDSPDYETIIKSIPLDKIMADTDSPYVAPVPNRGKRNEPLNVEFIVKKIAEIRGLNEEIVAKSIISNIKNLFNI